MIESCCSWVWYEQEAREQENSWEEKAMAKKHPIL